MTEIPIPQTDLQPEFEIESDPELAASDLPAGGMVIGHKTAISGTWTVGARLIARLFDLATMLVLAHILTPREFGLVAIAMTIIYIVEATLEMPISQALVRLHEITTEQYDTAFTLSLLRGAALTLVLCLLSVPFAHFYRDPRLVPLVCLLSIAPAARGLVSPRLADYAKNLSFSREFAMEFAGKVAAFASAVTVALIFRSYWSIAIGTIMAPVTNVAVSYVLAPYRPRFSLRQLPAFSGFLGWITVAQVISAINWQSDRLLLGRLMPVSQMGLFTTANDVANIPLMTLFGPLLRPLLSAFSLIKKDAARLASSYQISAAAMVTLGLPVLVGESLLAEPAVRLLFGAKWMGSAPLLRWLAISLIPSLFAIPMAPLVMSLDRTVVFVRRNAFEICIKLPLVVVGAIKFHFFGVIFARLISETATVVFCMIVVRSLIRLSVRDQVLAPWRSITSTLAMAGVLAYAVPRLTHSTTPLKLALGTVAAVALGALTYAGLLLTLWIWSGRPKSVEAMIIERVRGLLRRRPTELPAL